MWIKKIFGKMSPAEDEPIEAQDDDQIMLVAQLNARVQPLNRLEYFEAPLDHALQSSGLGEVTGGGTQMADEPDGIKCCDIEIMVNEISQDTLDTIISTLIKSGATIGSFLKFGSETKTIPFGQLEGMAVFLNGTDLPDEVYADFDVNEFISQCNERLSSTGSFLDRWSGSKETALYFYGRSFETMKAAMADAIDNEPGCAMARIVQIA